MATPLRQGAKLLYFEGFLFILLGIFSLFAPYVAAMGFEIFLGLLFLVLGFALLFRVGQFKEAPATIANCASGIILVAAGLSLLIFPGLGILTLSFILGVAFFLDGIAKIVMAFQSRMFSKWGLYLLLAFFDFVIAYIVYSAWPLSAVWFIGVLVGVNFLFFGFTQIALGSELRSIDEHV